MMKQLAVAIAALGVTTAAAQACPAPNQPTAGAFIVQEDFEPDPIRRNVTAGGNINLSRCSHLPGNGWVERRPDFVVVYRTRNGARSAQTLTFRIESSADTVLLINDPDERWYFNDDGGRRLNAKISFPQAREGRYDIWVGTFDRGAFPPARLVITELD